MMAIFFCASSNAQEIGNDSNAWSQILGPNRSGQIDSKLKLDWQGMPKTLWQKSVGAGFSGPVIRGDDLIVFHRPGRRPGKLVVEKLNATTGAAIWSREIETRFQAGIDGDAGPKATPVIDGDRVFCYGPNGELFCLDMKDGQVVWQLDLQKKFKVGVGYFGCGSSPIVVGKRLILNVGGREEFSIVAFDKQTGEVEWNAVQDGPSYSSPIVVEHGGLKIAVFLTRTRLVGIDSESGKVLFSNKFGKRGPTAIGAMPVQFDGKKIMVTAAYQCGALVVDLEQLNISGDGPVALQAVWKDGDSLASHYSTPVFLDGHFFGTSGREDVGNGSYRCVDARNGRVKWEKTGFPVGHTLAIGGQLLVLDHQGKLSLIESDTNRFRLVKSSQVGSGQTRAIPAFKNGRLFFRSNAVNGKGTLKVIQVAVESK